MKTLSVALCLLTLSACASRTPSPSLVAAAARPTGVVVGDVYSERGANDAARRVAEAHLTVTLEPVPVQDLGVPVRGYGNEWVLMDRTIERGPATTGPVRVGGEPEGWGWCSGCSDHWIAGQLGSAGPTAAVDPPQEYVAAHTEVRSVTTPRRANPIGDLLRGVIGGVKFVASPVATMVAAVAETPRAIQGNPGVDGHYSMTREAASWLFPDAPSDTVTREVSRDIPGYWLDLPMPQRDKPAPCRAYLCRDTIALRRVEGSGGTLTVAVSPTSEHALAEATTQVDIGDAVLGGTASVWPDTPWTPRDRAARTVCVPTAPEPALDAIRERDADALTDAIVDADLSLAVDWDGPPATLLHAAVAAEWTQGVALLLDAGADPNTAVGRFGKPPLAYGASEQHVLLVQSGALRTRPGLDASVWAAAPLRPDEQGHAARALAVDSDLVAPSTIRHLVPHARGGWNARRRLVQAADFDGISLHGLRTALQLDGPTWCGPATWASGTVPRRRDVRAAWGRPDEIYRDGDTWVAAWAGRIAVAQGRDIVRMTDDCAWETLLGHTRNTVHLAMGTPDYQGPAYDVFEDGGVLDPSDGTWVFTYQDDVLVGAERVYRP